MDIFNEKYRKWYHFFDGKIRNIYQIPDVLNKRLREKHLFVFFDEAHESDLEVLEWLRVLSDQVTNMSVILSGLPVFEEQLKNKLETFRRRIAAKIELLSLTKEDTESLVRKRIVHAGGSGREMDALMDYIYQKSGGFPREILRACGEIVNAAIMKGTTTLDTALIEAEKPVAEAISTNILEKMTPMQQGVIELLSKGPLSPGQIANALDLSKYKSRQHAVRSVNNIVKKLYEEGYLDRQRSDKAYIYSLSGRIKTLVVKS